MLSASLYIIVRTGWNRVASRLRRLREPRYLFGALAGVAYFYFAVFMRFRRPPGNRRGRGGGLSDLLSELQPVVGMLGAVGLLLGALVSWLLPTTSRLLTLSEAETNLLVPAPVTRRQLLVHRLLRSQLPLLFASAMSAVFVPATAAAARLRFGAALFLVFMTMRVYFAGVSMARARLGAASAAVRRVAWAPLVVLLITASVIGGALARAVVASPPTASGLLMNAVRATSTGPAAIALWPFKAVAGPLLADSFGQFAARLPSALVILACLIVWVLKSDEAFQASPLEVLQTTVETPRQRNAPVARDVGWRLALTGRSELLFLWKNAMQTLRGTNLVTVLPFLIPITVFTLVSFAVRFNSTGTRGAAAGFATASLLIAGFFSLLGPQAMRSDLREDLRHLDLIKTWPVKPPALIRGELLWPTLCLTLCAWCALASATLFSGAAFPRAALGLRLSIAAAALVLTPALVGAQITVHNAAAVIFPAWVPAGPQRARGLEAMGQRLILFAGVLIALVVMLGPGAIAGGLIAFGFYRLVGPVSFVPAAVVCLVITVVEIALVTEMLGAAYARIDLSEVERNE